MSGEDAPLRAAEAAELAVAVVELGLERLATERGRSPGETMLELGADVLFRAGVAALAEDASLRRGKLLSRAWRLLASLGSPGA